MRSPQLYTRACITRHSKRFMRRSEVALIVVIVVLIVPTTLPLLDFLVVVLHVVIQVLEKQERRAQSDTRHASAFKLLL